MHELDLDSEFEDLGFEFAHIGINHASIADADKCCDILALLGERVHNEIPKAYFTQHFEVMKLNDPGEKGHIGYLVNNMDRAIAYFRRKGINIVEETIRMENGQLVFAYLDMDISGFAVHIKQK